jgi:hypothetical protein
MHSVEGLVADADARQTMRLLLELPGDVGRKAMPYLAQFRPGSGRGLAWSRALRLAAELSDLVKAGRVSWEGRPDRPAPPTVWSQALERMIQQPPKRLPLKSHGYLRSVAWEIADEADKRRETAHNQAERDGRMPDADGRSHEGPAPVSFREFLRQTRRGA